MRCEKSAINMTLLQLVYLVYNLGNYAMILLTETGLRITWPKYTGFE